MTQPIIDRHQPLGGALPNAEQARGRKLAVPKVNPLTADIYAKVHEQGGSQVLAMSDPDLIGCAFSPGESYHA